jgi:hypothetical protein
VEEEEEVPDSKQLVVMVDLELSLLLTPTLDARINIKL